jgi:hypothetical protein
MSNHPERLPRLNPFWREQIRLAQEAQRQAMTDPLIRAAWGHLTGLMAEVLGILVVSDDPANREGMASLRHVMGSHAKNFDLAVDYLAWLVCEQAPALAHWRGPLLRRWLLAVAAYWVTGEWPAWIHPPIWSRCLPDNPIERLPDGTWQGLDEATSEHWKQLAAYTESRHPVGQPGKPQGSGGYFRNGQEFREAMKILIRTFYVQTGRKPSERNLAILSGTASGMPALSARSIRRYCQKYGVNLDDLFQEILKELTIRPT